MLPIMVESEKKSLVVTTLALAPTVWMISFNFGVYKTVFYDYLFVIWSISLAALICGFIVKLDDEYVSFSSFKGRLLLLLPTIWLICDYLLHINSTSILFYWLEKALILVTVLFSLPYILYYLIMLFVPSASAIYSTQTMVKLLVISLTIASLGFSVGHYHPHILFCSDFKVAGNLVPENCWPTPEEQIQ